MPWSPRAWGEAVYLAAGIPVQIVAGAIFAGMLLGSIAIRGPKTPLDVALIWLAGTALIFLLTPVLTRVHRHRLRATAGIEIPPQPNWLALLTGQGLTAVARSQATWRQIYYHVLVAPLLAVAAIIAAGLWPASVVCTLASAIRWAIHRHDGSFGPDKGARLSA